MKKRVFMLVGAALLLIAFTAAACDSSETDTSDLESAIDALTEQVEAQGVSNQRGDVLASLTALQGAELHSLNESLIDGELPEGATGQIDRAIRAMAIDWPADLQAQADELTATFEAAATAIDSGDAATAEGPVTEAHDAWHNFDHDASAWLTGEGHEEGEEGEEHDEMDMTTPAADEGEMDMTTPAADDGEEAEHEE